MDAAEERINAVEEEEEEEEVEEEVVEEEVEEDEEEEEFEEVEEEEEGGGDGAGGAGDGGVGVGGEVGAELKAGEVGEGGGVDSASEEAKQSDRVNGGSSSASSAAGKIFVGGVAWETTEDSFAKHFKKYGEITDSVIMKDKHTQKPRGFGFVTFADPSVIDTVLADEHVLDGRPVEVKRTVPREDGAPKGSMKTKKIFVGGIPTTLTEDEFKEHFSSYGKVAEHQIMLDHSTGRSRGFGFITFESEEAVEKVISNGKMQDLGGKQVEIKKAEPKKSGGDPGFNSRASYGGGAAASGTFGGGAYGYNAGYRAGGIFYGGRGGGGYGYAGGAGYGMGFAPGAGGSMYAAGGGYAAGSGYGGPAGYGGPYGYSAGRGYSNRYHPYGR